MTDAEERFLVLCGFRKWQRLRALGLLGLERPAYDIRSPSVTVKAPPLTLGVLREMTP